VYLKFFQSFRKLTSDKINQTKFDESIVKKFSYE